MHRFFLIVGIGGIAFIFSAFSVGGLDGILLGCAGFFMFLFSLVGWFLYSTLYSIGYIADKTIDAGARVVKKGLELAKDPNTIRQIEQHRATMSRHINQIEQEIPLERHN